MCSFRGPFVYEFLTVFFIFMILLILSIKAYWRIRLKTSLRSPDWPYSSQCSSSDVRKHPFRKHPSQNDYLIESCIVSEILL
uniref:Uncharacterized protein n=1 Tax=Octopus bimaculoides TaxID=37653 RepID=A0A0L8FIN8_OCTBM